jgi:hypothetical protein
MKLQKTATNIFAWFKRHDHLLLTWFFSLIFAILFINAFHEKYPDEFDNILGGWYIAHGIPIYTGFFTHHGPVAYWISALYTLISGNSFVLFRILFAISIFLFLLWSYLYLRQKFGRVRTYFYLVFIFIISLAGNYYWLHMLLADSLSAYFFAPVIAILLLTTVYRERLTNRDISIISVLTALSALCSLTYLYFSIIVYAYSLYLYIRSNSVRLVSKEIVLPLLIFAAPYGIFLVYLLATSSLKEYLYQGFTFNQRYYIYNYPRPEGVTTINPIRFAVVIANKFYNSYFALLQQTMQLNISFPLNIAMAVGTIGTFVYLLRNRLFLFAAVFMGFLIYANARSEPLTSKETDYQSAVYIMIAFLVIPFLLEKLYRELQEHKELGQNLLSAVFFLLLSLYAVFSSLFLFQKFFNRTYDKYMGNASLIYDRPELAPILNKIVSPNDPVWIGPFEFEELFYTHAKPASRFQIFIPGMGVAPEVRPLFLAEFERTKPPVIYFKRNFSILGRNPEMYGQFFIKYLDEHYFLLKDYEKDNTRYVSAIPVTQNVDLEGRLYIRNERGDEILKKMLDQGLIKEQ